MLDITHLITSYGYVAIFGLMLGESCLIPIPSEVTMPFAGFLAGIGALDFWIVILVGALGNLIGSILCYYLGYFLREENLRGFIKKWGKYVLIHEKDFDRAMHWYAKYGPEVTFASRLLPIVRTFISLPAGISEMNVYYFGVLTFIGSFIWSGILAYFGLKLGQNWQAIDPYFRKFQFVIAGLIASGIAFYIYSHLKKQRRD